MVEIIQYRGVRELCTSRCVYRITKRYAQSYVCFKIPCNLNLTHVIPYYISYLCNLKHMHIPPRFVYIRRIPHPNRSYPRLLIPLPCPATIIPITPKPIRADSSRPPISHRKSIPTTEPPSTIHSISCIALQPTWQVHPAEIRNAYRCTGSRAQNAVDQCGGVDVSAVA